MKASDAIAQLLAKHLSMVYLISGGANLHVIHSIADTPGIAYTCAQHECAAGYMADTWARLKGLGCACATSGPGATNLITAIGTSYYDSVPVLYLTGQQSTFRLVGDSGLRQRGFQETPIVEMVRPITKYAVMVREAKDIVPELEKAIAIAMTSRMGPVVVDIPDNLQRESVEWQP